MTQRSQEDSRGGRGAWRSVASFALQIVLTVVVTAFIVKRVGFGLTELQALDIGAWTPRWGVFALSCAILLAGYLVSAALWGLMVKDLGGPWLGLTVVVPVYLVANLGRYVPGKLWQLAGLAVLALRRGVPARVSTAAAALGQAIALGAAALVGSSALLGWGGSPGGWWSVVSVAIVAGVLAVALVPPLQRRAIRLWFGLAGESGASPEPGVATTLRWLALYTLNWMVYAGSFWVLVRSLDLPGSPLQVGPAFAAAYLLGYVALFAPAGMGVREGFLIVFLSPTMGASAAGVVSLVARLWTTGVEVIPALALWMGSLLFAERSSATSEETAVSKEGREGRRPPAGLPVPLEIRIVRPPAERPPPAPGKAGERYLVIVPTYNERENLPGLIPMVLDEDPRLEVLVVDDNSPDATGELAEELARLEPRLHVLRRSGKAGLGPAYLAGFHWALERDYRLVVEMDADLSHHPDNLQSFIEHAEDHDVVIGSRYVGGRVTVVNWPMSRLLISFFGSRYARLVTGVPVRDLTGGYNCWRREVLEAIDLSRVASNGYMFQIELKFRAWRRGFRIVEIPIVFTERREGTSKMSKKIVREAVWKVWKLRLMDLLGRL